MDNLDPFFFFHERCLNQHTVQLIIQIRDMGSIAGRIGGEERKTTWRSGGMVIVHRNSYVHTAGKDACIYTLGTWHVCTTYMHVYATVCR